jgi:hypothetical protein
VFFPKFVVAVEIVHLTEFDLAKIEFGNEP